MTRLGEGAELTIQPEPAPQEREAILRALAVAGLLDRGNSQSAWWVEGLQEALGDESAPAPNGHWND